MDLTFAECWRFRFCGYNTVWSGMLF